MHSRHVMHLLQHTKLASAKREEYQGKGTEIGAPFAVEGRYNGIL